MKQYFSFSLFQAVLSRVHRAHFVSRGLGESSSRLQLSPPPPPAPLPLLLPLPSPRAPPLPPGLPLPAPAPGRHPERTRPRRGLGLFAGWGWGKEEMAACVSSESGNSTEFLHFKEALICRFPKIKNKRRRTSKDPEEKLFSLWADLFIIILFSSIRFVEGRQGLSFFPHIFILLSSFFCLISVEANNIWKRCLWNTHFIHVCRKQVLCKLLYSDFQLRLWMTGISFRLWIKITPDSVTFTN